MSKVTFRCADYQNTDDAAALIHLLDIYARDPMGGGEALPEPVRKHLASRLADFPGAFTILGFDAEQPIALANCFTGFSTFACAPLVNIHDLMVDGSMRGKGVAADLLAAVLQEARARDCCKVTLEVLEGNQVARRAYETVYAVSPINRWC